MTTPQAVQALITPANAPAWAVVDAIDRAEMALSPYRAVQALATVEKRDSEQDLPQLRRDDLAALLEVLTGHMANQIATARALACERAKTSNAH
jgi:hypothetical protein